MYLHKRVELILRNNTIDCLKGFLLILVVIGHQSAWPEINKVIYLFHMPAFFIFAGYFSNKKDFSIFITSRVKGLLYPYILACVITFLYWIVFVKNFGSGVSVLLEPFQLLKNLAYANASNGGLEPNTPIWFLTAYFFYSVFGYLIFKMLKSQVYSFLFSVLLSFLIYIFFSPENMPFGIYTSFIMLPIYFLSSVFITDSKNVLYASCYLIIFILLISLLNYPRVDLASGNIANPIYLIVFTFLFFRASLPVFYYIKEVKFLSNYLTLLSNAALPIIVLHMPFIVLLNGGISMIFDYDYSYVRDNAFFSVVSVVFSVVLLPYAIVFLKIDKLFNYGFIKGKVKLN